MAPPRGALRPRTMQSERIWRRETQELRISNVSSSWPYHTQLPGIALHSLSFVSADGTLNVTAVDIDDDHDTDLVITPVLSRQVVGVWLNSGRGHFDRRNAAAFFPLAANVSAASRDVRSNN